jgi:hypothetical protein
MIRLSRLRDAWIDRAIERELTVGLSPRRRARLHDRLRRDARARARYDRAVEALRVLEGDVDVAPSELDVVGRWLEGDWGAPRSEAPERRTWPAVLAVLAAALVLLWISPLRDPSALRPWTGDDGWQARGGGLSQGLALEALCGPDDSDPAAFRVRARDCSLADLMGLAYRVPEGPEGRLTVFGVDDQGDAMFYLPTPDDPTTAVALPGRWRALSLAVRLRVNHAPGRLRIYGLVAPSEATVAEVEALARALAPWPPAEPGDPPWTVRLATATVGGSPQLDEARAALERLCPDAGGSPPSPLDPASCRAAELHLTLRPER